MGTITSGCERLLVLVRLKEGMSLLGVSLLRRSQRMFIFLCFSSWWPVVGVCGPLRSVTSLGSRQQLLV